MSKSSYQFISLDQDRIKSMLETVALASLSRLDIFETIDSTNSYLLQKAKEEKISGWVCLADEQTQGRGRHGRQWFSPKGSNIYCSILWEFSQQDISSLSLAVGVMVVNTLQKLGIVNGVGLKWPNDILFLDRKLGGILLERAGSFVVIGIGLNCYLPEDEGRALNAVDLAEISEKVIDRNILAGLLVNELMVQLPVYAAEGFGAFVDAWNHYNILRNKDVVIYDADKAILGKAIGINSSGELLILDEMGEELSFRCGEVSVRKCD